MCKKRIRIFAGPNGSGKSTIFKRLEEQGKINFGVFVNADEIKSKLTNEGLFDFSKYGITIIFQSFCDLYRQSSFFKLSRGEKILPLLKFDNNVLKIEDKSLVDSYFAAFIADYIRIIMLDHVNVFTIETVMSHESKIEYIKLAKDKGYKVYLYFVSTRDVAVNIGRVAQRVAQGGHDVPEEKIRKRYQKSLENLTNALRLSDRAYIFDNSERNQPIWYVEYGDGVISFKEEKVPLWIKEYLIDKLN